MLLIHPGPFIKEKERVKTIGLARHCVPVCSLIWLEAIQIDCEICEVSGREMQRPNMIFLVHLHFLKSAVVDRRIQKNPSLSRFGF